MPCTAPSKINSAVVLCRTAINHYELTTTDHGNESSHEAEVQQMVGVDGRRRVDLQTVVSVVGVLEQAVHRVEHFMRHVEKPIAAKCKQHKSTVLTIIYYFITTTITSKQQNLPKTDLKHE